MPVYAGGYEASAWYIGEGTEGTTPPGTYLALANHATIREVESPNPNGVRKSGSVDYAVFAAGYPKPMATITFHPTQANGLNFIANFLSTDTSFTLVTKNQNTGQFYRRYVGCKVKATSVKVKLYPKEDVVEVTCEIWGWSIQYTDAGGMSYESIPTSAVNWSDVTVKIGGSTITDWWEVNFSVTNELYRVPTPSTGATQSIKRGVRDCTGDCTRPMNTLDQGQTELQAVENATVTAFEVDLVSHTFQFNGGV
ncbi:MAG TPA: phage tail tube protein, partial [Anaerovoracaceae bacterium]|nr:phage tail tube protein [Anaerovoracaceae bacterium]